MRLSSQNIKKLCNNKGLRLNDLLIKSKVSRTAFYSLLRKESLLPKSVMALAFALKVAPSDLLEDPYEDLKRIRKLQKKLEPILSEFPELNRDNVWHTLILLQENPIERLKRSLIRGQGIHFYK